MGTPAKITEGLVAGAALLALVTAPARPAHACGGLFCNRPPPNPLDPLPVAQAGENVVFGIEGDPANGNAVVTAHIQILYSGTAAQFSWVVPVASVPELSTGTDRLFSTLGPTTQPRFQPTYVTDGTCAPFPFRAVDAGAASAGVGGSSGSVPGSSVSIAFQGVVGPYDAVVLKSSSASELKDWLTSNGYFVDPRGGQIIDSYVADGKFFVALKLTNGQDVRSIRPIVLTFHGTDPCVPLRLTAIAALPDMPVTVYVLGYARAVPLGFRELKLDELRIDWPSYGSNYAALLGEAANDAGGNAFVTEYAGTPSFAANQLWAPDRFNVDALRAAETPPAYVQQLVTQGLANDTATLPLLEKYIPMPEALQFMKPAAFYGNLSLYWGMYAFPPFDLATLTDHIVSDIIEPRHQAQLMIDAHAYLTRLGTFISPEEMNVDPIFGFNPDLPVVSALHTATLRMLCGNQDFLSCNAPMRLELPDGRTAWLKAGDPDKTTCHYPPTGTGLKALPANEIVWERGISGEGARVSDNRAAIQTALAKYNNDFVFGSLGGPGNGAGGAGAGGIGLGGAPGGGGGGPGGDGPGPQRVQGSSGCGCTFGVGHAPAGLGLVAGAVVVLMARGRRRRAG